MSEANNNNSQWGIVELMGHKVVAGRISKSEEFGTVLLRIDVPATDTYPEFTQMYGNSAIYCVTFTSEDVARIAARNAKVNPVSIYAPELVTREQFNKTVREWQDRLNQARGLPSSLHDEDMPSHVVETWEDEPAESPDEDEFDEDED